MFPCACASTCISETEKYKRHSRVNCDNVARDRSFLITRGVAMLSLESGGARGSSGMLDMAKSKHTGNIMSPICKLLLCSFYVFCFVGLEPFVTLNYIFIMCLSLNCIRQF